MSIPGAAPPQLDRSTRTFLLCLGAALAAHVLTLLLLRNATFFGMAALREEARELFRVPSLTAHTPRPRPQPMQVPARADVLAAVQRDVASAVADALADLPPAAVVEPPPGARLEEFARARDAEAPPRTQAPTHLDAVQSATALIGQGILQEEVQVVARRATDGGGSARAITAATAAASLHTAPTGAASVAGRLPVPGPYAPPAPPRPVLAPRLLRSDPPPPMDDRQIMARTRDVLDRVEPREAEPWEQYFDFGLTVYRPNTGEPGYFRLEAIPKRGAELPVAARSVLFVLDASKSMGTVRFAAAQDAFVQGLAALHPDDRFTVLAFQSRPAWWHPRLREATPNHIRDATAWIRRLEAEGRTDLYRGLTPALENLREDNRAVIVLLCSDGRPTAGERDSRVLINALSARLGGRASIFAYGAGSNVNRYLLDLLTYLNRGAAHFGAGPRDMGPGLSAMEQSIREPVYLQPHIRLQNAAPAHMFPRTLQDVYRGRALRVWGRLDPGATRLGVRLEGWSQGRRREMLTEVPVPAADNGTARLAQEWAYQKLYFLVGQLTTAGSDLAITSALAQLGQEYRLPQEYVEAAGGSQ